MVTDCDWRVSGLGKAVDIWWADHNMVHRVNVSVSSTVRLACEVHRVSPDTTFRIQWYKDGRPLTWLSRFKKKVRASPSCCA